MKPIRLMTDAEGEVAILQKWLGEVAESGLSGPSPGGAAGELGCSRAMIDQLVDAGVLERTEFNGPSAKIILISARSIEKAKRKRKETGTWTGGRSGRPREQGE
jgi:hypothetical protein